MQKMKKFPVATIPCTWNSQYDLNICNFLSAATKRIMAKYYKLFQFRFCIHAHSSKYPVMLLLFPILEKSKSTCTCTCVLQ